MAPSVPTLLREAYEQRDLPIKRFSAYEDWHEALRGTEGQPVDAVVVAYGRKRDCYLKFVERMEERNPRLRVVFVPDCKRAAPWPPVDGRGNQRLLHAPLDPSDLYLAIREIYADSLGHGRPGPSEGGVFQCKIKGEHLAVDTDDILFFEAQGKMIALKSPGQEVKFYSNFEGILRQLPRWFVRCHKGYVVNLRQVASVSYTAMEIHLLDQSVLPVSRSYRDHLRGAMGAGAAILGAGGRAQPRGDGGAPEAAPARRRGRPRTRGAAREGGGAHE
jgi:hypothetical protein